MLGPFEGTRPWVACSLGSALILVWCFRLFFVQEGLSQVLFGNEGSSSPNPTTISPETAWLRKAMSVEFPAPIDYAPLRDVCARQTFQPGLVFTCEEQHGGIGMVRNQILKCVRYAISGGAALVVPSMQLRNAKDITDIETSNEVPLEYLFDREAFVMHLTTGCPGMKVYDRLEDVPAYGARALGKPLSLVGDQFEPNHPREGLQRPREWRAQFDAWLTRQGIVVRADAPVHVRMEQSFMEYPVRDDGKAFADEFGKILSFRADTRALAAKILYKLEKNYGLPIDPATAIQAGAYFGAHLRVEADAIWAWPPSEWRYSGMEPQFQEQFRYIARTGLGLVYVASGNETGTKLFAEGLNKYLASDPAAKTKNVTVVTKHDLLHGPDRRRLDLMTFDQQALVDFMIMFKASAFMGVAHSSFPWTIALRRHEISQYKAYGNEGSDLLRDEYSIIMGMARDYPHVDPFVYGIWP